MKIALQLLVSVIFFNTMGGVYATGLGNLFDDLHVTGEDAVLQLSLLGKEEKHNRNYVELAQKLTLESNVILGDIDRYLVTKCKFGTKLPFKVMEVKEQINKVSTVLAQCEKNNKSKELLRFELNKLDLSLRNLEVEIKNMLSKYNGKCRDILDKILHSLVKLRGCVETTVVVMP